MAALPRRPASRPRASLRGPRRAALAGAVPARRAAARRADALRRRAGVEREGHVQRETAAHDRRCVELRLTSNGRTIVAAERARFQAKGAQLFAALEPGERAHAARLL